jgi:hypothetical protein
VSACPSGLSGRSGASIQTDQSEAAMRTSRTRLGFTVAMGTSLAISALVPCTEGGLE